MSFTRRERRVPWVLCVWPTLVKSQKDESYSRGVECACVMQTRLGVKQRWQTLFSNVALTYEALESCEIHAQRAHSSASCLLRTAVCNELGE